MIVIEDIAVPGTVSLRRQTVDALFDLEIGQSFYVELSYYRAHAAMSQSKRRVKRPLRGQFKIVPEGNGVRVGRIA